jgi:hypothetical protein
MLSIFESVVLQEYINKPRSEMTAAEKKRIKYASIKKRESLAKQRQVELPEEMFDLFDPRVEQRYKAAKRKFEKMQKMAAEKEKKEQLKTQKKK